MKRQRRRKEGKTTGRSRGREENIKMGRDAL